MKKQNDPFTRWLKCPKSPLTIFTELYRDVPIITEEKNKNNFRTFTATIEVKKKKK